MSKFLKISAIVFLSLIVVASALYFTYLIMTRDAKLDENKLISVDRNITLFDDDGKEIVNASLSGKRKSVEIESLQPHTVNAFIASEDRTFYKHRGLNYKRMLKALYKNVISGSFKEGASTISQQLIKNTHLTGDKTISRKLNEIRLTKALEKRYEKDEILEMYLNTIYFGHNCYGLESASEFYFDKAADKLDLQESAVLVGLLISPNNYSPFKNEEKCISRRNTVLKSMKTCGYINESEYKAATESPLNAKKSGGIEKNSDYVNAVLDELEEIDIDFYKITDGCKIMTYMQPNLQRYIEKLDYPCDNAVLVTSTAGGVNAYKSTVGAIRRQPGSTVKPLMVYGPAIEEKQLSPFTKILDEQIDYGGYSPENFDKKYHGYVSVADSLKYSYNVPAVKTLNSLTVDKSEKYINAMRLPLDSDDKNLSLALGGMKYGLTLKELCDGYSVFANGGQFAPSRFIKRIIDRRGKVLYENTPAYSRVFTDGTCSLMNEMLIDTSKSGTAKKLKDFSFDVATKTGTCGNDEGNTDAYSISYTSQNIIGVWLGDKDNTHLDIYGGVDCCEISKQILFELYSSQTPAELEKSAGTQTVEIDLEEYYLNNRVMLTDALSPMLNNFKVKVLAGNIPKETSTRFSTPNIQKPAINVKNDTVNIELCQTKYYAYLIYRNKNGKNELIYDGEWKNSITDKPGLGVYIYTVTPYYFDGKDKHFGSEITLPAVNVASGNSNIQDKVPDIAKKDWSKL